MLCSYILCILFLIWLHTHNTTSPTTIKHFLLKVLEILYEFFWKQSQEKVSLRQAGGLVIGYCQYVDNVMRKNKMKLYGRFYTKDIYKIIFLWKSYEYQNFTIFQTITQSWNIFWIHLKEYLFWGLRHKENIHGLVYNGEEFSNKWYI